MITFNTSSFSQRISETDFGNPVLVSKAILIPYFILNIFLGLLGNSVVIRSTLRVDVWNLNVSLIMLLRYLALTDAGLTLFHIIPQFFSLLADSWILGKVGIIIAFVRYPLFMMEMSLVLGISLVKLKVLIYPFKGDSPTTLLAIKIVFPLLFFFFLVIDYSKIIRCYINDSVSCYSVYKPSKLRCSFKTDDRFGGLLKIGYGLFVMALLILTNVGILLKVCKSYNGSGKISGKSFAVISTVCWVFIVSYLPFLLISKHLKIHPDSEIVSFASEQFVNLSVIANPIIYTVLYKSFAEHVKKSLVFWKRSRPRKVNTITESVDPSGTTNV